jgi:phosphoesterase RecJ-like protein
MSTHRSFDSIVSLIRSKHRFLVLSHFRPDGDAIGCTLAMGLCLEAMGKQVTFWNEDGLPERFRFLSHSERVVRPSPGEPPFDAVFLLDTAVRERAGEACLAAIPPGGVWVNIDHHVSNDQLGDLVYLDTSAPATGQILYELITHANLPLNREIAESLYTALSTDTGSFQYANTTARTYEIAGALVMSGVDVGQINQNLYQSCPKRRIELLRSLLNSLQFDSNNRVASFALTLETTHRLQTIPDDTEGLIDHLRCIEGVVVAAFFEEAAPQLTRISLRSKDSRINVCAICSEFGGGGHTMAAGARIEGPIEEVRSRVLAAIERHFSALN